MHTNLSLDGGPFWGFDWQFKIEQDKTNEGLIFEMLYPKKINWRYSLYFTNITMPTTYKKMFLQSLEISEGENIVLDNSSVKYLSLFNCSKVKIINTLIKRSLVLVKCMDLTIENCTIKGFNVPNGNHNIKVRNSIIKNVTKGSELNYDHID
jgi:hypothetical protein